jgi:hypothetical protein
MRSKFKWIYTLLIVLSIQLVSAQEKTVTGVVSDSGPLPGVNVVVRGTKQSAQTDLDGKYNVQAKAGDVLTLFLCRNDRQNSGSRASSTVNVILKEVKFK